MKLFNDWGFTAESWQGRRGEYWVLVQALLLLGFVALPVYRPFNWAPLTSPQYQIWLWSAAACSGVVALVLMIKGVWDLGQSLTPLPYPKDEGELVQSGVYGWVRHPLYGGITLAAIGWALYQASLSHLVGAIVLLIFFDAKARREEEWLAQKYPAYSDYQKQVKKLIPWVY